MIQTIDSSPKHFITGIATQAVKLCTLYHISIKNYIPLFLTHLEQHIGCVLQTFADFLTVSASAVCVIVG